MGKKSGTHQIIKSVLFYIISIFLFSYVIISLIIPDKTIDIFRFQITSISTLTESMKPSIEPGDIIVLKKISKDKIEKNDVISFFNYARGRDQNNNPVWVKIRIVHRIIDIDEVTGAYITQGDNNDSIDTIYDETGQITDLTYDQVIGGYFFRIPILGKVVTGLRNPVILVLLVVNVGIVVVIVKLLKKKPEPNEKEVEAEIEKKLKE